MEQRNETDCLSFCGTGIVCENVNDLYVCEFGGSKGSRRIFVV
jgi:hypothetical protein